MNIRLQNKYTMNFIFCESVLEHIQGVPKASLGTLRDHCTGNPPAGPIFQHFATWHVHVQAVWAKHDVCNDLEHNVDDKGQ